MAYLSVKSATQGNQQFHDGLAGTSNPDLVILSQLNTAVATITPGATGPTGTIGQTGPTGSIGPSGAVGVPGISDVWDLHFVFGLGASGSSASQVTIDNTGLTGIWLRPYTDAEQSFLIGSDPNSKEFRVEYRLPANASGAFLFVNVLSFVGGGTGNQCNLAITQDGSHIGGISWSSAAGQITNGNLGALAAINGPIGLLLTAAGTVSVTTSFTVILRLIP